MPRAALFFRKRSDSIGKLLRCLVKVLISADRSTGRSFLFWRTCAPWYCIPGWIYPYSFLVGWLQRRRFSRFHSPHRLLRLSPLRIIRHRRSRLSLPREFSQAPPADSHRYRDRLHLLHRCDSEWCCAEGDLCWCNEPAGGGSCVRARSRAGGESCGFKSVARRGQFCSVKLLDYEPDASGDRTFTRECSSGRFSDHYC